jgi:hypothetical protein
MNTNKKEFGGLRAVLAGLCLVVMVAGLLSIPFVSMGVAISIVACGAILYLLMAVLVPKGDRTNEKPGD